MEDKYICLCCEKQILSREELLYGGGYVEISFGYGSVNDQGHGWHKMSGKDLLDCDIIEGYICDECFDKKRPLLKGFLLEKKTEKKRTI